MRVKTRVCVCMWCVCLSVCETPTQKITYKIPCPLQACPCNNFLPAPRAAALIAPERKRDKERERERESERERARERKRERARGCVCVCVCVWERENRTAKETDTEGGSACVNNINKAREPHSFQVVRGSVLICTKMYFGKRVCLRIHLYICVCVCMYVCIYVYICSGIYMCMHVYKYSHIHICMPAHVHTQTCTLTHT